MSRHQIRTVLAAGLLLLAPLYPLRAQSADPGSDVDDVHESARHNFRVVTVVEGLE